MANSNQEAKAKHELCALALELQDHGNLEASAIIENLKDKRHLGVHTELLSSGVVDLMKAGVIDNSTKTLNRGKTVASFCMGTGATYAYLHNNPAIEFRPISFTNDPLTIARIDNMTAINTALQIDLTGQSTAESIGPLFYSGIGGHAEGVRNLPGNDRRALDQLCLQLLQAGGVSHDDLSHPTALGAPRFGGGPRGQLQPEPGGNLLGLFSERLGKTVQHRHALASFC